MADLKLERGDQRERPPESPGGQPRWLTGPVRDRGLLAATARPAAMIMARVWQNHRLIVVLVALAIVPRVIAALAFKPALMTQDSFSYLQEGIRLGLGQLRPAGYPILLFLLSPFHSLLVVTTVQHVLGLCTGIIVYAVLRHWGLPAWGAALAAVPTLFDSRQIMLESSILPDTLFTFAIVAAVALLLTRRKPTALHCGAAGALLAWATVIRGNGFPVIVPVLAFVLARRLGWRRFCALLAAFAIPLLAYTGKFYSDYGQLNITNSGGIFLWSRTMSFANCAVINPPPDLLPLCPDRQPNNGPAHVPAWSVPALLSERSPSDYMWAAANWWRSTPATSAGVVARQDALATRFALRAIEAQPLDYLRVVARDVMLTFLATDRSDSYLSLHFKPRPHVAVLAPYMRRALLGYAGTSRNTFAVQPYAFLMFGYQLPVWFPGYVFLLVVLAGLIGVLRNWRRWGGPAALPWAVAAVNIVVPIALHERSYRYAITAIPLACMAAGLAFIRDKRAASAAGAEGQLPGGMRKPHTSQDEGRNLVRDHGATAPLSGP